MLQLMWKRSSRWFVRRASTKVQEKPKLSPKKFNIYHPETRMDDMLARESPLMERSKGKVKRPPFLRNLFAKAIDERFLTYPEVLEPSEIHRIADLYDRIKEYVDSLESHTLKYGTPKKVIYKLKEFGVFGATVSNDYGGLGLSLTEYSKIIEAFARQPSLAAKMISHSSAGIQPILEFGTDQQKASYLPKLASGEWIAALAMHESQSGTDLAAIKTVLKITPDESHYTLNGTKTYVTNGEDANIFTVLCNIDLIGTEDKRLAETPTTAVLVARDLPGVKVEKSPRLLGLNGAGIATVTFDNVKLSTDCILGKKGEGFQVALAVQNYVRCLMTAATMSTAREALNLAIKYAIRTHRYKKPLHEFEMIGKRVATMTGDVYAMESAVYMTSAIADVVQDPDYSLEAAAVRLLGTKGSRRVLESSIDLHGVSGLLEDGDLVRWLNDIRTFDAFESTQNLCRLLISMSGVQYTGRLFATVINILRDPLMSPMKFTKLRLARWRDVKDTPKLACEVEQFIHPSLKKECQQLEYCMARLGFAAEVALEQWGAELFEHQTILDRLSDIAIDVYTFATVLARASRSYCIGLPNSDYDIKLSQIYSKEAVDRVRFNVNEIQYCSTLLSQRTLREINAKIFNDKKYIAAHPLTRNWD